MNFTQYGALHKWLAGAALLAVGTFLLALALTPTLAQTGSNSLLTQYDANANGTIEEAELLEAVADHNAGTLSRADVASVGQLYLSTLLVGQAVSCSEYDSNGDGGIDDGEAYIAYIEFTEGLITAAELAMVYACPPPPPTPTPTPTPTNTPTHTPTPTPTDTPTPTPIPPPPGIPMLPTVDAPSNLRLTSWNSASVNLAWDTVTGASGYRVSKQAGTGSFAVQGSDTTGTTRVVLLPEANRLCLNNARYAPFTVEVRAIGNGTDHKAGPGDAASLSVNIPCRPLVSVSAVSATVDEGQRVQFRFKADPPPLLGHDTITVSFSVTSTGGYLRNAAPASVTMRGTGGSHTLSLATNVNSACSGDGSVEVTITGISFSSFSGLQGQGSIVGQATAPYGIGTPKGATVTVRDTSSGCLPPPPPPGELVVIVTRDAATPENIDEGVTARFVFTANRTPATALVVIIQNAFKPARSFLQRPPSPPTRAR